MFLLHFLGGEEALIEKSRDDHVHKHMMPCCCLPAWLNSDGSFTRKNSVGNSTQFVLSVHRSLSYTLLIMSMYVI
jgi:hypothetical protein